MFRRSGAKKHEDKVILSDSELSMRISKNRFAHWKRVGLGMVVFLIQGGVFLLGESVSHGQVIKINLVDGKVCARCMLSGPKVAIPANVVFDFGSRIPLRVHEKTGKLLGLNSSGEAALKFDEVELAKVPAMCTGLRSLELLSQNNAQELGEIPAAAIVGLPALAKYVVQLDVSGGELRLLPPSGLKESGLVTENSSGLTTFKYDVQVTGYWLTAEGEDGFPLRVQFATRQFDTIIDGIVADMAGAPGGDIDRLMLDGINLGEFVAFRPEDLSQSPGRPDLVLGTNLLESFLVTINQAADSISLKQLSKPVFPKEEREFFVARSEEDAEAIESFLEKNPKSRLAGEAAELLLSYRLAEDPASREKIGQAMDYRIAAARLERRSETMVSLADELLDSQRADSSILAFDALSKGLVYAGDDLNASARHEINARLGKLCLDKGDLKQARRHLLSAAFGMPRNGSVNLWLGGLYERTGKPARAWSRYVQAAISEESPAGALTGLDRLNRDPSFRSGFSMEDARQLLEGRVVEFHPPNRFERNSQGDGASPVDLVELFTCIDEPRTMAAELAFSGLLEYFEKQDVTFLAYHVRSPESNPLVSQASESRRRFYDINKTPVVFFNGNNSITAGGDEGAVARTFAAYKAAAMIETGKPADWSIQGSIGLKEQEIAGTLKLSGPEAGDNLRLVVLLCEKAVMVPGANSLMLHYEVVRGMLSPDSGFAIPSASGERVFEIRTSLSDIVDSLSRTITDMEKEEKIVFAMKPVYVDADMCSIAVFLQDCKSKQVLVSRDFEVVPDHAGGGGRR